jgi:hypothetical protein
MSKSIHLKCDREGAGLKGLKLIDRENRLHRSVSWELSQAEADEIVGGWVYFHPSKAAPSEFGGIVVNVEHTDKLNRYGKPEIAIILQFQPEARGQKWRGANHGMAWCGGVVPKTLEHELVT